MKKFLSTAATIFSGAVFSSLFITHTDSWKVYLVIVLFSTTLKDHIEND